MGLPTIQVQIAWDSGFSTPEASRTWTDVSAYVEGAEPVGGSYGRSDEQSAAEPNRWSVTLNNRDGRFTPERAASPYYPNVKKGKPIRISARYAADGSGNFLSANQASFETSVADWTVGGSVPPAIAQSATHVAAGSQAMRITWGTGGVLPWAGTTVTGLVVGRTYIAQARVWVTAGTPDVLLAVSGVGSGIATTTKGAFATISYSWVATSSSHALQVWPATSPTSGQQCWVDSVMVDEGSTVGTFTTSPPPTSIRFTGYVDEWPLVWPDGSHAASTMTVTASSRRARMGQTAPLTSAIRGAYLATSPESYWPMDESGEAAEVVDRFGNPVFRDVTNAISGNFVRGSLGSYYQSSTLAPVLRDGTSGPTDEESLVRFPSFSDAGLIGTFSHYVGAGTAIKLDPSVGVTAEVVARATLSGGIASLATILRIANASQSSQMYVFIGDDGASSASFVGMEMIHRDPDTFAVLDDQYSPAVIGYNPSAFLAATDGGLHHYALTLTSGNVGRLYFDGTLVTTLTLTAPYVFADKFTNISTGDNTWNVTTWAGHMAVHTRALTGAEIATRASAAIAANESDTERVVRVAGRVGVPSTEIDVETSAAQPLGPQPEAGRGAAEVLDELATSTSGVLYDTRAGHLALQARNHRYNVSSPAFTLNATTQEVAADLTATLDDRYLANYVEITRTGSEEQPFVASDTASIDDYGYYSKSLQMVSSSETEVQAAAQDQLDRYATPRMRVSQVTVDLVNIDDAQRVALLNADIGTMFNVSNLPAQAPSDPMSLFVEGYTETITATTHTLTINTTPSVYTPAWVLGDASLSNLGSTTYLAY